MKKENIVRRISKSFSLNIEKFMPDPWIWAMALTILAFVLAFFLTPSSPIEIIEHWAGGFSYFLAFSMQMVLVLVTGTCLGTAPIFKRLVRAIARLPKGRTMPYVYTVVICAITGYINWGLSFVLGALLAKQIAIENERTDFPLLVSAAFCGAYCGIYGLSNAPQLAVASPGHSTEQWLGVIPITETTTNWENTLTLIIITVVIAFLFKLMAPFDEDARTLTRLGIAQELADEDAAVLRAMDTKNMDKSDWGFAQKIENSVILTGIFAVAGMIYVVYYFATKGFDLNLNIINFLFIILGMAFHKTPASYLAACKEAVKSTWSLILQFPWYGGILVIMINTGLVEIIAGWFVSFSTRETLPFWQYISAGIINFFIPSGGGQWAVQGPIAAIAANELGTKGSLIVSAVAYGDIATNYLQPFWALPMLSMAGLKVKDIWGTTMIAGVAYIIIVAVSMFLQGMFVV